MTACCLPAVMFQSMPHAISAAAEIAVSVPPEAAFDAARGLDAVDIIRKQGLLPGVAKVEGDAAPWSVPGQQRIVTSTDGSRIEETLTALEAPRRFAYCVKPASGALTRLVRDGASDWRFEAAPEGTRIRWTYAFTPLSAAMAPLVWVLMRAAWHGYMQSALSRLKARIESGNGAP